MVNFFNFFLIWFIDSKKGRKQVEVERDRHGNVVFPIQLGSSLTIHSIGSVIYDRPAYHTDKYICKWKKFFFYC